MREAIGCGILFGIALAAVESLVEPARDLGPTEYLLITGQMAVAYVAAAIALTVLAFKIEQKLRGKSALLALLLSILFASALHSAVLQLSWWLLPGIGVDAMLMFVPDLTSQAAHVLWIFTFYGATYFIAYNLFRRSFRLRQQIVLAEFARTKTEIAIDQAHIEDLTELLQPSLLVASVTEIGRRYALAPDRADRLLDLQVAFLRAAMPQLRTRMSDLGSEIELVASFVALATEMNRFPCQFAIEKIAHFPRAPFPPLILTQLVDRLARAIPAESRLTLSVHARDGIVQLEISASDHLPVGPWLRADLERRLRTGLHRVGGTLSTAAAAAQRSSSPNPLIIALPVHAHVRGTQKWEVE